MARIETELPETEIRIAFQFHVDTEGKIEVRRHVKRSYVHKFSTLL